MPEMFSKFVLSHDSKIMYIWTMIMIISSIFSSFFAALFACFGEPEAGSIIMIFDTIMEVCFIVDLIRTFFTSYTDPK